MNLILTQLADLNLDAIQQQLDFWEKTFDELELRLDALESRRDKLQSRMKSLGLVEPPKPKPSIQPFQEQPPKKG